MEVDENIILLIDLIIEFFAALFIKDSSKDEPNRIIKIMIKEQEWFEHFYNDEKNKFVIDSDESIRSLLLNKEFLHKLKTKESERIFFKRIVIDRHKDISSLLEEKSNVT
ncbi:hypothetical protein [Cohnella mopanensis]|uniref:hypothetical protein n=1 Tax=Cohnella mopanensis TaxID=2911966 RepID=UPI001EF7DB0C|nr:hypothetical protein [Cohnella mopanensis]